MMNLFVIVNKKCCVSYPSNQNTEQNMVSTNSKRDSKDVKVLSSGFGIKIKP